MVHNVQYKIEKNFYQYLKKGELIKEGKLPAPVLPTLPSLNQTNAFSQWSHGVDFNFAPVSAAQSPKYTDHAGVMGTPRDYLSPLQEKDDED